jgi:hypothetical protein
MDERPRGGGRLTNPVRPIALTLVELALSITACEGSTPEHPPVPGPVAAPPPARLRRTVSRGRRNLLGAVDVGGRSVLVTMSAASVAELDTLRAIAATMRLAED